MEAAMDPQQFGTLESGCNCSLHSLRKGCGKGALVCQTFRIQPTNPRSKDNFLWHFPSINSRSSNTVSFFPYHEMEAFYS